MALVPHMRVTLSGSMTGQVVTPEIFACGFALGDPTGGPSISLGSVASTTAIVNACKAFWARPTTGISTQACLRDVTVALIGPDGRVGRQPDGSYLQRKTEFGVTEVKGGGGTDVKPYQVALAVSLSSALGSGAHKGRFYLPSPSMPLEPDGRMLQGYSDGVATSVVTLFQAINTALGADGERVAIASSGSVLKGLPAKNYPVVAVRVGRVLDTIRSRRNALDEQYSVQSL